MNKRDVKTIAEQADLLYRKILEDLMARQAEVRAAANMPEMFDYLFAKMLCNGLVYHLTRYVCDGDMEKVRDFITKGINIDLAVAAKISKRMKRRSVE